MEYCTKFMGIEWCMMQLHWGKTSVCCLMGRWLGPQLDLMIWSLFKVNLASSDWVNRTCLFGSHLLQENWIVMQHGSRHKENEVPWRKLIWFPETNPRHGLIGWLTLRNRLTTRKRMLQWCYKGDRVCVWLCSIETVLRARNIYSSSAHSLEGFGGNWWNFA